MAPLVEVLVAVFVGLCRIMFEASFQHDRERAAEVMALDERAAIRDRTLLWQSLAVLALAMAAFVLHPLLHYEPSVVAVLGAGLLVAVTKVTTEDAIREVEWSTLVFFSGLFVMVGALVETGVIGQLSQAAANATQGRLDVAATMSPIVADLVQAHGGSGPAQVLWSLPVAALPLI